AAGDDVRRSGSDRYRERKAVRGRAAAHARTERIVEQQTATSEVLSVISSSPGELEPVFNAMLENALRICEAKFGLLFRFDGTWFHPAAGVGRPPEYAEFIKQRGDLRQCRAADSIT